MKQTLIIIRGPAAVGKTSIATEIVALLPKMARLDMDDITWWIGGKPWIREDYAKGCRFALKFAEELVKKKYSVIFDELFIGTKQVQNVKKLANQHNLPVYIFSLTAALEKVQERNKRRPKYKQLGSKWIQQLYNSANKVIVPGAVVINTEKKTPRAIAKQIIAHITNS